MPTMNFARTFLPSRRAGAACALGLASILLVAGCSAAAMPTAPATPTAPASPGAAASPGAPSPAPSAAPGRPSDLPIRTPPLATLPPTAQPVVGEAPVRIVAAARVDLAGRVGATDAAGAQVVRSEAVTWPDGSLGCPVRGQFYPQMVTPGYRVVLDVGGTTYDYRATDTGLVVLCEHGAPGG
jgi:hypothetical protein